MPQSPARTITPPRHLMPLAVQGAFTRVGRWRVFTAVALTAWVLALVGGSIPLVVHLFEQGWQAGLAPGAAMLFGVPAAWAGARAVFGKGLAADRTLLAAWRRYPRDARWSSSLVLAEQMDRAADGDPEVRSILQRMVGALFGLFSELAALDHSIAADREIASMGGDQRLHHDLVDLRAQRDAQLTRLVDALRELHLGLVRRHAAPGAVRAEVGALLDQLEAEREVDGLGPAAEGIRLAAVRALPEGH